MRSGVRKLGISLIVLAVVGVVVGLLVSASCGGAEGSQGPQGAEGPAGATGPAGSAGAAGAVGAAGSSGTAVCSTCHNETTLILSKRLQWDQSGHATGGAYVRGTSSRCAGCHSSEGFTARIAAGLDPDEVEEGIANPTPQNCRTCHDIHTSFTLDDFSLTTTDPVTLFISGETFDMGLGNLCANCHQPRAAPPEVGGGDFEITSRFWGPHYGTQSTTLLGIGGYGEPGSPSAHYMLVEDGCPVCHMGPDRNHTLEPQLSGCQTCHEGLDTFDRNDVQTDVQALIDELEELLIAVGIMDESEHAVPGTWSEAQAGALWNWLIVTEDSSFGVHNSYYIKNLLETAIEALQ